MRAFAYRDPDPDFVLARTNEALVKQLPDAGFVTVLYGTLDVATGDVRIANAGHPDPYVCGAPTQPALRRAHDPPLGAFTGTRFRPEQFRLERGEALVMFTDGVLEARRGVTFLGETGVHEVLSRLAGEPAPVIARTLLDAAVVSADGPVRDDIAVVVLRYVGG